MAGNTVPRLPHSRRDT